MQAQNSSFLAPHHHPGRLVAADGLDGSGKSTQLQLLSFWLRAEGYDVLIVEWTSSKLVKHALKAARKQGVEDPRLLSLLHAADIAEIYQQDILPALQRGALVLADRYIYTALARDLARGVEREWVQQVYQFAVCPDLSIYFQMSVEEALFRSLKTHSFLKYEQRSKVDLATGPIDDFRMYQQRVLCGYEVMVRDFTLFCLDATLPVKQQQFLLRAAVQCILPSTEG